MTLPTIRTVGVIGTGVIGASWTALFLARGLKVIVTDPAPGADGKLRDYLLKHWPTIPNAKVTQDEYLNNFEFVKEIDAHLGDIHLIQEVSWPSQKRVFFKVVADRSFNIRMDRRGWTSSAVFSLIWTQIPPSTCLSHRRPPASLHRNLSLNARKTQPVF